MSSRGTRKTGKKQRKSFGPVESLEEHVPSDWWRRIFNSIYLKTDGDVVNNPSITKREVDLFTRVLKLSPEDRVLDLCCGHGRHTLELARRGFKNVEGLDISRYLVQKARSQAKREGLRIRFRIGDARKLPYHENAFDVVMILGNSFGYFETIEEDMRVLREVFRVLKPYGRILIDVADGEYLRENFKPRSWEWIDRKHFVCRERSLSLDKQRLISREIFTHIEKGVVVDQFYAERLYTREGLKELLERAGFSDVTFHGAITSDSQRGQDLGMMEKRIVVTAIVRKDWKPTVKQRKELKTIVVILGDPTKRDPVKPGQIFDDDDLHTISRLKEALRELEPRGYRFVYLNNHSTLIHDLMKLKRIDLVFNLCDEGYNNDPRKELHVPALLEVLDIPYTGAPPHCLAYCYDKMLVRSLAMNIGIPVPSTYVIEPGTTSFEIPFEFPVIVKPNFGDSSFGITQRSVVNSAEELLNAISEIRGRFGYDKQILVEEFLPGDDLTLGIIGNPPDDYVVLPITKEDYSSLPPELPKICGYEAKWCPHSPYWNIKSVSADLPEEVERFIVECSLKLFERLECRDYCRFDWRIDSKGKPRLLEVNPNPGWCWDGHLAKAAGIVGIPYSEMLEMILRTAMRRLNSGGGVAEEPR